MKQLFITAILIFNSGCALFSGGSTTRKEDGFTKTAAATGQPIPLPIEIAEDIAMISEGGLITTQEGQRERLKDSPDKDNVESGTVEKGKTLARALPKKKQLQQKQAICVTSERLGRKVFRRPSSQGKSVSYVVKPTDTLMKISFAHFGNVYRWREIYRANQQKISDYNQLIAGTVLTINGVTYVRIDRNGKPYLIRWGDTLGKISRKVYGTKEFWEALMKNNRQLIRNPNKIYADFTLYYRPIDEVRGPTSEGEKN